MTFVVGHFAAIDAYSRRLTIPFDATGKKWVRFAAWDAAGNGAMVQPIKLNTAATTTTR